jgi:hypothetical protein
MDEQPRRSWFGRNWKWAVTLGCLMPFLLMGGCTVLLLVTVFGTLRSSDAYTKSLEMVRSDERVVAALGEPIEPSFLVQGNINVSTDGGHAEIQYDVTGPKDSATVEVVADKVGGMWQFKSLKCKSKSSGEPIDLLSEPKEIDLSA